MMQLEVLTPTGVLVTAAVAKVIAEADNGSFCLLPRHIDFVAALTSGVLSYWTDAGEHFVAVDEGTLVKCGARVLVSARNAIAHDDLATLERTLTGEFDARHEQERQARSALARLEAAAMRRFVQLEDRGRG
jgi:F-type H+-transporting ATPase subunit epsilon